MKRALAVLFLLLAAPAVADVVFVSVTMCAGGGHELEVKVGNVNREVRDASMTSGSANLDSATASWVAGDVGRWVSVLGAGPNGNPLVAQIQSRTNATRVVLTATASSTGSGRTAYVVGATQTLVDDDSDESQTFKLWVKRQISRGKTKAQTVGHKIIADVP